ncbi:MAG: hypothetical protein EZS28_006856 [Streblomastix strix]|uniref:Uncharacterized protein n=1 Tax=Streblomastix strix TaxID=222440 RepID=A0A5J4WU09_9EUKA|nr:MAG: hypothetical protein EZS28_006856 [Streblomastix strix]
MVELSFRFCLEVVALGQMDNGFHFFLPLPNSLGDRGPSSTSCCYAFFFATLEASPGGGSRDKYMMITYAEHNLACLGGSRDYDNSGWRRNQEMRIEVLGLKWVRCTKEDEQRGLQAELVSDMKILLGNVGVLDTSQTETEGQFAVF